MSSSGARLSDAVVTAAVLDVLPGLIGDTYVTQDELDDLIARLPAPTPPWLNTTESPANLFTTGPALPYALTRADGGPVGTGEPFVADLGDQAGGPRYFRVRYTIANTPTTANFGRGAAVVQQVGIDNATVLATTTVWEGDEDEQLRPAIMLTELELLPATRYVRFYALAPGNYAGTVTLTEADGRLLSSKPARSLAVVHNGDPLGTAPQSIAVAMPVLDRANGDLNAAIRQQLSTSYDEADIYDGRAYVAPLSASPGNLFTPPLAFTTAPLHVGNNGLILNVKKADNTYELRGNVHGGETLRTGSWVNDVLVEIDRGDGVWSRVTRPRRGHSARRVRITQRTTYRRSDGLAFLDQDNVYTYFTEATGTVMRWDRELRFTAEVDIDTVFFIMNSFNPQDFARQQKAGAGRRTITARDYAPATAYPLSAGVAAGSSTVPNPRSDVPGLSSEGWNGSYVLVGTGATEELRRVVGTSGAVLTLEGTLDNDHAAGEPLVQVAARALTTAASIVGASALLVNQTVPRGASAWIIGKGTPTEEVRRFTSSGAGFDPTGPGPYTLNLNAPLRYAHPVGTTVDPVLAGDFFVRTEGHNWVAYREPTHGVVFAQIFDPATIASHEGITGHYTDQLRNTLTNFIAKAYTRAALEAPVITVAAGTTWSDTYYFVYDSAPGSDLTWADTISARAALRPDTLAQLYPNT